jgi:ubiquinone/menaquinone biosynthesis C-methylase UbiE
MRAVDARMTEQTIEHSWDDLVATYERWAEPTSARLARLALDRAAGVGSRVLDVAAGTGALALAAAERGSHVLAIDSSPGMVNRLTERLGSYPGCSAEVMDATKLPRKRGEFDAAFSVLGVTYFGPATVTALSEMVRVVRPDGVVGIVHWARPLGAGPIFLPIARALERLADPEVGALEIPLTTAYLERVELEDALSQAGCVDVRSEALDVDSPSPTPETFLTELDLFFRMFPQYRAAMDRHADRFRALVADEASLMDVGANGDPIAHANVAFGRTPH